GDGAAGGAAGEAALAGEIDQFVVAVYQFGERRGVDVAQDRDEDTILRLDGKADVDGSGVNDPVADEPTGRGAVFGQRDPEGAKGVKGGARFGGGLFAVGEE